MYKGGGLCGARRYSILSAPEDAGYCHCRLCQRSSGAPVLAWATFPAGSFRYTQGTPGNFKSSAWGQREFCRDCGTQLLFRNTADNKTVDINMVTLDDPEQLDPEYHIWTESQLKWFDISDHLPRHKQDIPNS